MNKSRRVLGVLVALNAGVGVGVWALLRGETDDLPTGPLPGIAPQQVLPTTPPGMTGDAGSLRLFSGVRATVAASPATPVEPSAGVPTLLGIVGTDGRVGALLASDGEPRSRLLFPGQSWMGYRLQRVSGKKAWLLRDGQVLVLDVTTQWKTK